MTVALGLLGAAAPATAAPTGGTKAPDVVRELSAAGYAVQINGDNGVPLAQCTVTDVHGVPATRITALQFTTVYVDVECEPEG
ncbi:hypothetical protein [Mycolicibacterium fortuitum]|uniref:hypothetical protein n=1 Tax=Mycolicibacterium fortuitum TaxID=1766 RepID=UPI001F17F91E|nr:hypothetical protein [Mycolicibacterium fortuitum]